ncbi:MAG TPA: aldolase/citrate lyase family protein [Spirochaetota bacterium]|nr:aldolase/citrate lyase family protein [Spirochaetota bacterium]HOM38138.1 aldolase/citrate lyase family protein [Spirochaetota bacterium]HPQ48941.1 aldolase/citrate lyase family protein [Spirochaetota bacterium]
MFYSKIRKKLLYLRNTFGIIGLKGGTEVEDLNFKEIAVMRKISSGIMPLTVKIGGPEARNDMRECIEIGVDVILAPMIESPYALENFITSSKEVENYYNKKILKAINFETITCYKYINEIFSSKFFADISSITIGRTDLAGSMGEEVDSDEVINVTKDIVKRSKEHGKKTSVGGKIKIGNIEKIAKVIMPDMINTRHIIIDVSYKPAALKEALVESLLFEIELYKIFSKYGKKEFYKARIEDTLKRAGLK